MKRKPKEPQILVFCGDCEHFVSGFSDREYEHCAAEVRKKPKKRLVQATYKYPMHFENAPARTPAEKNANNQCWDYKARKTTCDPTR